MLLSSAPDNGLSLMLLEGGLTLIALAVPFALPNLGNSLFFPQSSARSDDWRAVAESLS
jgi:hypothetical protein